MLTRSALSHLDHNMGDQAWGEVIAAMDQTYAELVGYQGQLESRNSELESMRDFLESVLASVSDILIVTARNGQIEQVSASVGARCAQDPDTLRGQSVTGLFSDPDAMQDALERCRSTRSPVTLELDLRGSPAPMPHELVIAPRRGEHRRVIGFVLTGLYRA